MKKIIIPHKIVIDFGDGSSFNGVIIYKTKEQNGSVSQKYFTLGIKNAINIPQMNIILKNILKFTEEQEDKNA